MEGRIIGRTESLCPVCLERIPAVRVKRGDGVFLEKSCPAHGFFSACIWKGRIPYESWDRPGQASAVNAGVLPREGCPYDCGLCTEHEQKTCCVLLEVTSRCNLSCPVCFAGAGETGDDLSLEEIHKRIVYLMEQGGPFNVQLSGGEPAVRDDLDVIIRMGKQEGIRFFQLNTNGIRLAQEPEYAGKLARAGLDCVFLQFDGMDDKIYEKLRGRALLECKKKAVRVCREQGLGVVLVPVIAKGVNVSAIGGILDFALEQMPAVRGVHFQPLSYFGRYDPKKPMERFTLPELLEEIEVQTQGRMKKTDFTPGNAESPYCSISGNFRKKKDGTLEAWTQEGARCCCHDTGEMELSDRARKRHAPSDRAREFVARQWAGQGKPGKGSKTVQAKTWSCGTASLDNYIDAVQVNSLAVSAMGFMDAWNLDLERLKRCYIHVVDRQDGRLNLIPFCAYNLTSEEGETLYRGQDR